MKKIIIIALLSLSGVAQAACEQDQKIVDNLQTLKETSQILWLKTLITCYEEAKERRNYQLELKQQLITLEKDIAERNLRRNEQLEQIKQPVPGSETYYKDLLKKQIAENELAIKEFSAQCPPRKYYEHLEKFDQRCLEVISSWGYHNASALNITSLNIIKQDIDNDIEKAKKKATAEAAKWEKESKRRASLPGVSIGDSANHVIKNTSWGRPDSVNRTTTAYGTQEQWVYGSRNYLYFTNGILTTIQN